MKIIVKTLWTPDLAPDAEPEDPQNFAERAASWDEVIARLKPYLRAVDYND